MKYWVPAQTKVRVWPPETINNIPDVSGQLVLVGESMIRTSRGVMYDEEDVVQWCPTGEVVLAYEGYPIGDYYVFRIPKNPYKIQFIVVDDGKVQFNSTWANEREGEVPTTPRYSGELAKDFDKIAIAAAAEARRELAEAQALKKHREDIRYRRGTLVPEAPKLPRLPEPPRFQ